MEEHRQLRLLSDSLLAREGEEEEEGKHRSRRVSLTVCVVSAVGQDEKKTEAQVQLFSVSLLSLSRLIPVALFPCATH